MRAERGQMQAHHGSREEVTGVDHPQSSQRAALGGVVAAAGIGLGAIAAAAGTCVCHNEAHTQTSCLSCSPRNRVPACSGDRCAWPGAARVGERVGSGPLRGVSASLGCGARLRRVLMSVSAPTRTLTLPLTRTHASRR